MPLFHMASESMSQGELHAHLEEDHGDDFPTLDRVHLTAIHTYRHSPGNDVVPSHQHLTCKQAVDKANELYRGGL